MRSYLFVPATRADLIPKALGSDADVVVLDFEDGIASERAAASETVRSFAGAISERPTHVRVAGDDVGYVESDIDLALDLGVSVIRLPKAENSRHVGIVAERLSETGSRIHVTIESAAGVRALPEMAQLEGVERLVFGERDFVADLGVEAGDVLTDHVRASLSVDSRALGLLKPIDGAFTLIDDLEGLRASAMRAKALGFWGKSVLHPRQIPVIHDVFRSTAEELRWAEAVTEAYDDGMANGEGGVVVDGEYVDLAVVRRARDILDSNRG